MTSDLIGKVLSSTKWGEFKVLRKVSSLYFEIMFLGTGYKREVRVDSIRSGVIKDPFKPSKYGVGFIGEGAYKSTKTGKHKKEYWCWSHMIGRCYDPKFHSTDNYKGRDVYVCEEWHNYQNFAKWYEDNSIEDWELDKDITYSKVYSPDTCHFLPKELNMFFTTRRIHRGNHPIGVTTTKNGTKYIACCCGGKEQGRYYLGRYDTEEEAFFAYKDCKEALLRTLISKYKDVLPDRTLHVLENWRAVPYP